MKKLKLDSKKLQLKKSTILELSGDRSAAIFGGGTIGGQPNPSGAITNLCGATTGPVGVLTIGASEVNCTGIACALASNAATCVCL